MDRVKTNQIINGVVYVNGSSMLGRAAKVDLPDVEIIMTDHMALGMVAEVQLPSGIKALNGSIDWNSFYQEVAQSIANPFSTIPLMVRQNVETWDATGRILEVPLVTEMHVLFTNWSLGKQEPRKKAEYPSKFSCNYLKQMYNGVDLIELDVMSNIFKVNGINQLAVYSANTGA